MASPPNQCRSCGSMTSEHQALQHPAMTKAGRMLAIRMRAARPAPAARPSALPARGGVVAGRDRGLLGRVIGDHLAALHRRVGWRSARARVKSWRRPRSAARRQPDTSSARATRGGWLGLGLHSWSGSPIRSVSRLSRHHEGRSSDPGAAAIGLDIGRSWGGPGLRLQPHRGQAHRARTQRACAGPTSTPRNSGVTTRLGRPSTVTLKRCGARWRSSTAGGRRSRS